MVCRACGRKPPTAFGGALMGIPPGGGTQPGGPPAQAAIIQANLKQPKVDFHFVLPQHGRGQKKHWEVCKQIMQSIASL